MNMFEMSIEEVIYSDIVEIRVKTKGELIKFRAKHVDDDYKVYICEAQYRTDPVIVLTDQSDMDREALKNFFFDWLISEDGTKFIREVFSTQPPKIEK